ncbi:dihydrolipoyl dehydrogenase [Fusibacter ferrireducens]|uniref:Dihydrolipoyl dehydrogenase n=1 Tax=Fusibacter ferrireducens TaxID=2785058 RepID=A0ABR9ZS09_9FIRM|nr:dihydrolipoyl dehydrogenase [Fusibacter ferrireducens]MBF4692700.1 dihydrolipoyl dehydrogenase [Fusibacter ferrireducens]
MKNFDIVVLGGGPGGYVAAIKASQLGAKVAVIEMDQLGGVCLNIGCIPTKTLLRTAKLYQDLLNSKAFGIDIPGMEHVEINWENLMNRKKTVVKKVVGGVQQLMKYNNIEVINGFGTLLDPHTVEVNGERIVTKNLILATGSSVKLPKIEGIEEGYKQGTVIDSTGAIELKAHPKSMTILGGGVIAVEFATLFNSLGTKVTMLQRSDVILKNLDEDVRNTIQRHLINEGVEIITNTTLKSISGQTTYYESEGALKSVKSDFILASLGRVPNLKGIENLNLKVGRKGVEVDSHMETNVKGVYAVGDMVGKMMLAHVASAEGIVAAEAIMGTKTKIDYNKVPACIYSFPEVGVIGYSEEDAKKAGFDVGTSVFPLSANGKAMAEGETTGFVKIVHDKKYGEVLGVHIVASHATDMIAEAAVSLELEGTIYDLAKTIHPHPTLSEIVMEAAHGAVDKPIHIVKM